MKRTLFILVISLVCGGPSLRAQAEATGTNTTATANSTPAVTNSVLTVPPYLQVLSPESVALLWQTDQPSYSWVEYGATEALGKKQAAAVNGLRTANVTEHRVVLDGLLPQTRYYYRVVWKPIRSFGAYKVVFGPEEQSETIAFRTLPARDQKVTAIIFNDLHNKQATFQPLRQAVGNTRFDFSLFNGDCLADPASKEQVVSNLVAFTEGVQAGSRPAFFVRGNHENRGAFARDLPRFFAWPGGKPYYAFTAGPVRWLVLDCGEDKSDDDPAYSGLVDFDSYRREETEWLKHELNSRAFRTAPWRVLVHHIPIYPTKPKGGYHKVCRSLWGGLLSQAHINLAINAHTHAAAFLPAEAANNAYPIANGGGPELKSATVMILEADRTHFKLRMLNAEGQEVFPTFEKTKHQPETVSTEATHANVQVKAAVDPLASTP